MLSSNPSQNSNWNLAQLKTAIYQKLNALEQQARRRLIFNGGVDDTLSRIALIRTRMRHAQDMESLWDMVSTTSMLEKEMGERQQLKVVALGGPGGQKSIFFNYLLSEHLPTRFVHTAMLFQDEVRARGWRLRVDNGIVYGAAERHEGVVGQLALAVRPQAAVSSERGWRRRGEWSALPFCCSVKLSSGQLGMTASEIIPFIMRRMDQRQPHNKMLLYQMDSRFMMAGFSYELNEDGTRLHLHYFAGEGKMLTATIYGGRMEVPPEAWQMSADRR